MTEKEKMLAGKLYCANDSELLAGKKRAQKLFRLYNGSTEDDTVYRQILLTELLGGLGENCCIEPPFRVDYGFNIFLGKNFYANFDCIILDVCKVSIGDNVMLGPRVGIYTAGHPTDPAIRMSGQEFGQPITIGNNVWIGGNSVILPGVTIGDNAVIGAGSIVTKDVPGNSIAVGNPCRPK